MKDKTIEDLVIDACIADDNIKRSEVAMEINRRFAEKEREKAALEHRNKVLERALENACEKIAEVDLEVEPNYHTADAWKKHITEQAEAELEKEGS